MRVSAVPVTSTTPMTTDPNDPLAPVRQEFARGLPNRLGKIRSALTALLEGFDGAQAEQFHVTSHALVGMAATFEAHEMAEQAHALAMLGRRWRKEGAAAQGELAEAHQGVELLEASITAFMTETIGGDTDAGKNQLGVT